MGRKDSKCSVYLCEIIICALAAINIAVIRVSAISPGSMLVILRTRDTKSHLIPRFFSAKSPANFAPAVPPMTAQVSALVRQSLLLVPDTAGATIFPPR